MTNGAAPERNLRRLWRQLSARRRRQFFLVLGLTLLGALAEVLTLGAVLPFLAVLADPGQVDRTPTVRDALGTIGIVGTNELLLALTLLFAAAAIAGGAIRVLLAWASNRYSFMLGHDLGMGVYQRVLHQPYRWHVARNSSEVIAAINKVQIVTASVLLPVMQGISAVMIAAFIVAALMLINPLVSLAAFLGFGLLYTSVSFFSRKRMRVNSQVIARTQTSRIQSVQEGLGGIRDVLLDGSQPVFLARFRTLDAQLREAQATSNFIAAAPRFVIEGLGMVLIVTLAYVLAVTRGSLMEVLPILGALALGAQRLLPLMQLVYSGWIAYSMNRGVLGDVLAILDQDSGAHEMSALPPPLPFAREIAFRDLSFRYGADDAPVLSHVDLRIKRGQRIGIVGRTGSGKSTLVDLLMGLLEPSAGRIEVDGQPLDGANRHAWQRRIAHVPQAIYLSDASIAENIAFGVLPSKIDRERVREAARQAELRDFIEEQPKAYDTLVGERGVRLSGGQRQRIGIARALYKQADVLVFDEATSALDTKTEAGIMAAMDALSSDLTIFIIAHRLSTVEKCDRLVRLEKGTATSQGWDLDENVPA